MERRRGSKTCNTSASRICLTLRETAIFPATTTRSSTRPFSRRRTSASTPCTCVCTVSFVLQAHMHIAVVFAFDGTTCARRRFPHHAPSREVRMPVSISPLTTTSRQKNKLLYKALENAMQECSIHFRFRPKAEKDAANAPAMLPPSLSGPALIRVLTRFDFASLQRHLVFFFGLKYAQH